MRSALFVLVVAMVACGAGRSKAPHWPKQTVAETDGGESLEPRRPMTVAASDDDDDDEAAKPEKPTEKPAAEKPEKPEAKPEPATAPAAPISEDDDPITTEEIVIEIEDD